MRRRAAPLPAKGGPVELTAAERAALELIAGQPLPRVTGGWRAPGTKLISRKVGMRLLILKLAGRGMHGGLYATPIGKAGLAGRGRKKTNTQGQQQWLV